MTSFQDELRKIPALGWFITLLASGAMFCVLMLVAAPNDKSMSHWPLYGQLLFSGSMALIVFVWVLLISYIAGDARLRGMRAWLWVLISIFVPNMIGIILYFVFRDPIVVCRNCGYSAKGNFTFCPQCGTELQPACPSCRRAVEAGWKSCAYCGAALQGVNQQV